VKNLQAWFDKGMNTHEYVDYMQVHKDHLLTVYNQMLITKEEATLLRQLQLKRIKTIVLTADWCGDAMVNIPIFLRLANEALIETRFLIRDENLELMDQYLTNGTARSIPIFIFLDEKGNEIGKWGPRSPKAQQMVEEIKQHMPKKDDPTFDGAFKQFVKDISVLFTTNEDLWDDIKKDMMKHLI
jgi:hypothetical protein